jgi:hypothetical protein
MAASILSQDIIAICLLMSDGNPEYSLVAGDIDVLNSLNQTGNYEYKYG